MSSSGVTLPWLTLGRRLAILIGGRRSARAKFPRASLIRRRSSRYYAPKDGPQLVRRAGQDSTINDVLVFAAREGDSLLYVARDLEASIVTANRPIADTVRAEVAQQQHIWDLAKRGVK